VSQLRRVGARARGLASAARRDLAQPGSRRLPARPDGVRGLSGCQTRLGQSRAQLTLSNYRVNTVAELASLKAEFTTVCFWPQPPRRGGQRTPAAERPRKV